MAKENGKAPKKSGPSKTKYQTSKATQQQKEKEQPLVLRKNSSVRKDSTRKDSTAKDNASKGSSNKPKKIPSKGGPRLGKDTSTPREDTKDPNLEIYIQKVADAQPKILDDIDEKPVDNDIILVEEVKQQDIENKEGIMESKTDEKSDVIQSKHEEHGNTQNGDEGVNASDDEEEEEEDSKNYPSVCRRCYINFSTQQSPVCDHRFCDECFEKCKNSVSDPSSADESIAFACFTCAKSENPLSNPRASLQRITPIFEHCGSGVEKVFGFGSYAFLNPQKLAVAGDTMIVVDAGCGKILLLDTNGEVRQFSYLKNYRFQGGFTLTSDDILLLSLENEKYTSVSFYTLSGTFKFSAFLDAGSVIPHIITNSDKEIITLNTVSNNLDIINQEKRVHKTKHLSEHEVFNPVAIAIHPHNDHTYIYDGNNQCISVFDNKYNFLSKFSLGMEKNKDAESQVALESSEKTMKILIDEDGILLRIFKTRIIAYSIEGQYISEIVVYMSNPSFQVAGIKSAKPMIRDVTLPEPRKLAVLMVGGAETGQIRMYSYNIPSKYRTKPPAKQKAKRSKDGRDSGPLVTNSGCVCAVM